MRGPKGKRRERGADEGGADAESRGSSDHTPLPENARNHERDQDRHREPGRRLDPC